MARFRFPEAVVVISSREDTVAGLDPEFVPHWEGPHTIEWQEGGHVRAFELGEVLSEDENHYRFADTNGDTFELRPLTLELYEKHVRKRTVAQRRYESLRELLAAMRRDW